jgi:hypothetical protein
MSRAALAASITRKALTMIEMYKDDLLSLTNDYVFRRVFAEKNPGSGL